MSGVNDMVRLSNRAASGKVEIYANSSQGGNSGEFEIAQFMMDASQGNPGRATVSASGDLNVEGEMYQTSVIYSLSTYLERTVSLAAGPMGFSEAPTQIVAKSGFSGSGYTMPYNGYIASVTWHTREMDADPSVNTADIHFGCALVRTGSHTLGGFSSVAEPDDVFTDINQPAGRQCTLQKQYAMATCGYNKLYQGQDGGIVSAFRTYARGERPVLAGDRIFGTHNTTNEGGSGNIAIQAPVVHIEVMFDRSGSYGNRYGGDVTPEVQTPWCGATDHNVP
jgi:hypothetical protein